MLQDSNIGIVTSGDSLRSSAASKYEHLISRAKEVPPAKTVVVHPCDETSLRGASRRRNSASSFRFWSGRAAKITAVAEQHGIDIARYEIVDAPHSEAAAAKAVELILRPRASS